MDYDFNNMIDESMALELNVGKLYRVFRDCFPDDAPFWRQLSLEENNHAALLRTLKSTPLPVDKYSVESLSVSVDDLRHTISGLTKYIDKFRDTPPSRSDAFNMSLEIERSIGEIHFQVFVQEKAKSQTHAVFQQLNKEDKDHAERIQRYMQEQNIERFYGRPIFVL